MKNPIPAIFILFCAASFSFSNDPYVIVLGNAQDAGAPQMGCVSQFCSKAWKKKELQQKVSSIGLVEPETGRRWIFDATPDLPAQFQMMKDATGDFSNRIDGIFLTHAHIGHYTGLMYLGRESMSADSVPVYAMPRMRSVLQENIPWSQLVSLKNIILHPISDGSRVEISDKITIEVFEVPHRDEFSETVGYRIITENKSLIFLPDIDKWSKWKTDLKTVVAENDFLLLDGTFYEDGEISRPISEVPHPFVSETMKLLEDLSKEEKAKVLFIHFNHSNPLIQGNKSKLKELRKNGFSVAGEGLRIVL